MTKVGILGNLMSFRCLGNMICPYNTHLSRVFCSVANLDSQNTGFLKIGNLSEIIRSHESSLS